MKIRYLNMDLNIKDLSLRERYWGLEINRDCVKLLELFSSRKGFAVGRWGSEPISGTNGSNDNDVRAAIKKLKERLGIRHGRIVSRIDDIGVRHLMTETPMLSYPETEQWLMENISGFLPAGISQEDVRFSFQIGNEQVEQQNVLLAIARKNEISNHIDTLKNIGFEVEAISSGSSDLVNVLALQRDEFYQDTIAIVNMQAETTAIIICERGHISFYKEIRISATNKNLLVAETPVGAFQTRNYIEEGDNSSQEWSDEIKQVLVDYWIETLGKKPVSKIMLTSNDETTLEHGMSLQQISPVEIMQPMPEGAPENAQPGFDYSLPAGLALKGHYPFLNTINFLPVEHIARNAEEREKRKSLRIMLIAGSLFLVMLCMVQLVRFYFAHQLSLSEDAIFQMQSHIVTLEKLKNDNEKLSQRIRHAREIIVNRSNHSQLLWEISRLLPEKLWLRELSVYESNGSDKKSKTTLNPAGSLRCAMNGFAFSEQQIAQFLKALEDSERFTTVRLLQTKMISAKEVYEKSKLRRVALIRFEVEGGIGKIW
ncbi:hypothetical protein GF337_18370 [candidate division KSB1 bacterium]|nr:hypothetical protein [candidate division KSB1 bacterium]